MEVQTTIEVIAAVSALIMLLLAVAAPSVVYAKLIELSEDVAELSTDHSRMRTMVSDVSVTVERLDEKHDDMKQCLQSQRYRTEENQRRIHDMLVELENRDNGGYSVGAESSLNCGKTDCPICDEGFAG